MARRRARVSVRVAEIASTIAAQRSAGSVHILRVWQASRGRELSSRWQISEVVERRRTSASGDMAMFGWTNPHHVRGPGISRRSEARTGKRRKSPRIVPLIDALHGTAMDTFLASSLRLVRSPERAARGKRRGDRGVRSQVEERGNALT